MYSDILEIVAVPNVVADIKTSIATSTSAVTYMGVTALNGRVGVTVFDAITPFVRLRAPTVTSSAVAVAYNTTNPIIFTGLDKDGGTDTAEVFLTLTGGGESVQSLGVLASVFKIDVPAQLLATGAFQFGLGDLVFDPPASRLVATTTGSYVLRTTGSGTVARTITCAALDVIDLSIERVTRAHTTVPFKVYFA